MSGIEVLVHYPPFGSLWLAKAEWHGDFVEGELWDDTDVGSPYFPDDYRGEPVWMNFPIGCVDKVRHNDSPFWIRRRENNDSNR